MVTFQLLSVFLTFIALFPSATLLAYAQERRVTVEAVLACPIGEVLKNVVSCTLFTLEELEAHIQKLTVLLLQGNKTHVAQTLQQLSSSQKQALSQRQYMLLRESFARSVKNYTPPHGQKSIAHFFEGVLQEFTHKNDASFSKRNTTAEALMSLVKTYTEGTNLISSGQEEDHKPTALKTGAMQFITQRIPYGSLLRNIAGAWSAARQEITQKDQEDFYEDELIRSSPLLSIAHTLALEKALTLLYILFAPSSHPCERMKALYLINHIHLLGSSERVYRSCVAYLNYACFSARGTLLEYDPTRFSTTQRAEMAKLVTFLKKLCLSRDHLLHSLHQGATYGISALQEEYFVAAEKEWKQKKQSRLMRYSQEIIKGVLGCDLSLKKVDPLIICKAPATKDFIQLMSLCEVSPQDRDASMVSLVEARSFIAHCKNGHHVLTCPTVHYMQRYYDDALGRIPLEIRNYLNQHIIPSLAKHEERKEEQLQVNAI